MAPTTRGQSAGPSHAFSKPLKAKPGAGVKKTRKDKGKARQTSVVPSPSLSPEPPAAVAVPVATTPRAARGVTVPSLATPTRGGSVSAPGPVSLPSVACAFLTRL